MFFNEEPSCLNTVQYMLQRRDCIEAVSGTDEKEYNKNLEITILDDVEDGNRLQLTVEVYKTWNYSFSQDIESAAKDTYGVTLTVEDGRYVICDVVGFGQSIFDETLMSNHDKISQSAKDQMLSTISRELALQADQNELEVIL